MAERQAFQKAGDYWSLLVFIGVFVGLVFTIFPQPIIQTSRC